MKELIFEGSGVALVTPFTQDGVDFKKLGELVEYHIENNTDALVVCGTTGEATTMSDEEQLSVIKYVVDKTNKRIPVIAGTGSNNTMHSVYLSQEAERLGADGLLVSGGDLAIVEAIEDINVPEADAQESMVIRFL